MTDEQRLQLITEQLIIVRDNLFRGLSKSMQKLQAQSINEVLELPNYTQSPQQRTWVGLTDEQVYEIGFDLNIGGIQTMKVYKAIEAKLKQKNTSEAKLKESDI
jgi:hypothetical protein